MARYTTEYGELIRTNFQPLLDCLANYPLYDEAHREELNEKILGRYKFREIGFETAARFVHYFRAHLAEIMPYYNELFRIELRKINPLQDADYTETTDATSSGTSKTKGSSGNKNVHLYSDTPQGGFSTELIDGKQTFTTKEDATTGSESISTEYEMPKLAGDSTNAYMSEASVDVNTGANIASGESSTDANAERKVSGKFPGMTYGAMLEDWKKAVWNIDRMILDDLNVCFMGVY